MQAHAPIEVDITTPTGAHRLVYAFNQQRSVQALMHATLVADRFYEPETTLLLASVLKPGDVFIDVGAHVGYYTVLAASLVGPTGQVISFEPAPDNYAHLVEHVRLNKVKHVLPLHCAAGAEEGVMTLHLNSDNDGGHALWDVGLHQDNHMSRATPRAYPVFVATIDRVLSCVTTGKVKAIKIDVEGNEHSVLRGALRTLTSHRVPFVIAEINRSGLEQMGSNEQAFRAYMTSLGYETWLLQPNEPQLLKLNPDQTVIGNYVFNLLFRRPEAAIG